MAAAVLTAAVAAVVVMIIVAALIGWQRVRVAADLTALAGAVSYGAGEDACDAAARVAAANQTVLQGCVVAGDLLDYVVTVEVTAPTGGLLPQELSATAHAGSLTSQ